MDSGSINVQINNYKQQQQLAHTNTAKETIASSDQEGIVIEMNENSSVSEDEEGRKKIKRLPGETKEQAIERYEKTKEMRRLKKLMKYAYPR